ncbi:MAG: non-heme iron oxygenase ferredoxin subunit [Pseudomonadota bacterium]
MTTLVKLCRTSEVEEGAPVAVYPDEFPPLAVYRIGQDFFVTNNTCTHGEATLTDGYQEGNVIACPLHGGSFDIITGRPVSLPCRLALQCHQVTVEDNSICIALPNA